MKQFVTMDNQSVEKSSEQKLNEMLNDLIKENEQLRQRISLMEPIVRDVRHLTDMLKVNMIPVYVKTLNNNITKLDLFDAQKTGELE